MVIVTGIFHFSMTVSREYFVQRSDTLWGIAKRFLGTGFKWSLIYSINRAEIGPNPDTLRVGQRLLIPIE
jgi:nucleoid-associated protein YgaU